SSEKRWRLPDRLARVTNPQRHRAERDLLHLAMHSGDLSQVPVEVRNLGPEIFSDSRHATTWRVILALHERGEHTNYVNVAYELRGEAYRDTPGLSDGALLRMAKSPELKADKAARALR